MKRLIRKLKKFRKIIMMISRMMTMTIAKISTDY